MATRNATRAVNKELERAISEEVREIRRKHKNEKGEDVFVYSAIERMRVIDRALKLEGIKSKFDDTSYGKGFMEGPDNE